MIGVHGFEAFWAKLVHGGGSPLTTRQRIMLDMLGLGLEQTYRKLAERPSLEAFAAWTTETAGPPDPERLARYHAYIAGEPPPPATQAWLDAIDAAPPVLDAADLAQWDAQGYVILRNAIAPSEATAIEAVLWRALDASPDDPSRWYPQREGGIMLQIFQHPAMDVPRYSARVHKAFAQLWGTANLWSRVDRLSFNPPERPDYRFPGPHLHWDVSLAPPIPFATQGILYLTDTAADQGAFQLVPGFHHRLGPWLETLGDRDPRAIDLSAEAVPIAAGAGDLIIWRNDLPHGASPNRAARPRMAHYVNMYPASLTSNPVWR
ncbi:phytanoyl-CoA dioxygenase family protein [Sphingomonas hengshuiensis]|uniref:phytanoyl-CoA dioxygenase family protein n=1 Tax=Sphingomonas hengshuiensis TaxID=1609977 RepID=UPI000980C31F|nr:phytanoyl-CoA dioxygenase family protein [Sphingomonas hengshuiensis]